MGVDEERKTGQSITRNPLLAPPYFSFLQLVRPGKETGRVSMDNIKLMFICSLLKSYSYVLEERKRIQRKRVLNLS